ncbi:MFS transporter [bacterium]|nr:MAG: MFS transporter [bacterium]
MRKLSKNVISLGFVSFLNDAASEIIYPLLPAFLSSVLGAGALVLGVIEGIAETTASILKFLSGYLSDRIRKRKGLVVAGYSLAVFGRPLIGIATSWIHVLLIRFLDRVGKGIRTSPRDALIADSTPPHARGLAYGFHRAMDHLGAVAGPLFAVWMIAGFGMDLRHLFLTAFIPGILALLILFFFVEEKKGEGPVRPSWKPGPVSPNFKLYLLSLILFTLGNSSDAFLLLKAQNTGIRIAFLPLIWVFLHVVKVITSIPGGVISDRIGRRKVMVAGSLVYALIYLGFGLSDREWHIWLLFALYGIYFGLTEGVEKAFVADLAAKEERGTAFGLYHLCVGLSALPASVVFGYIWQQFGELYAFLFGAVLSFIASFILLAFVKEVNG